MTAFIKWATTRHFQMDTNNTIPPGLRNPADIFFQKDGVRRAIVAAFWTVIILAIPLWWHTTSIERLPLPDARVSNQVSKSVSIPVRVCVEGASDGLVSRVQAGVTWKVPARWKGLEVTIAGGQCGGAWFWFSRRWKVLNDN